MIRLGLCCLFREEPITFRSTTARYLTGFPRPERLARLSALCLHNARSLGQALGYAAAHGIGAFRALSQFFPLYTHPELGYGLDELPAASAIRVELAQIARFRAAHGLRLSFHPDQFIVLSSPKPEVAANAGRELAYQTLVAELVGAEVINVHAGGAYGNKQEALARFAKHFRELPEGVRSRLTVENDDRTFTVRDLLPLCAETGIPLVYDVHHHRCLPDGLSEGEATRLAAATWERTGREPYFHLSSPRHGWGSGRPRPHADYIDPADFPACWRGLDATVDVEAKAKELAVRRLKRDLSL
ncbi:MAG: UV DNA damage repair endonuclease UvsE [Desulfobacteraceae bacterium]|nr:UV DNA damage repair endonuclease UvsE [Desulfobacteraceae bacterium]